MVQLREYRLALSGALAAATRDDLIGLLNTQGSSFVDFVVRHGLGPVWHARTGSKAFKNARHAAEALYLAQEQALDDIEAAFSSSNVNYAIFKGGANRYLLNENPALRACYDLDVLVRPTDRLLAAETLSSAGFAVHPDNRNVSRAIVLSRDRVNVDLHWALLREGRLRHDRTEELLERRTKIQGHWMLHPDDALFVLLVHPAFAKHLSGWNMGLHRVSDVVNWLDTQPVNWPDVLENLRSEGVTTAAWATLSWVEMVSERSELLAPLLADTCPGTFRRGWIRRWLETDSSARLASKHWLRLLLFTSFLHDTPRDALRALAGRSRAWQREQADSEVFGTLLR